MPIRGDRLAGIREFRKLRRRQLALLTGMNPAGIQHLEDRTNRNPRYDTVEKLAEKLDVTSDYLGGAGPDLPFERAAVHLAPRRFQWKDRNRNSAFNVPLKPA